MSLREKCPNKEIFLVRVFLYLIEYGNLIRKSLYSVRIQENTDQKKLRIWTLFTQCRYMVDFKKKAEVFNPSFAW